MYYYFKNSKEKIVHSAKCTHVKDLSKLGTFKNLEQAYRKGYRLCRKCSPIGKMYRNEAKLIGDMCSKVNMTVFYRDDAINVVTSESKWKLIPAKDTKHVSLYHQNTCKMPGDYSARIYGYHLQKVKANSLVKYLEYIVEHDVYRKKKPMVAINRDAVLQKDSKSGKKARAQNEIRQKKRQIRNVLNIIESLGVG